MYAYAPLRGYGATTDVAADAEAKPSGGYGWLSDLIGGVIAAGTAVYTIDQQRRAAKQAEHQAERDAAAAAQAQAAATANYNTTVAASTGASDQVSADFTPGELARLRAQAAGGGKVPTWALAGGGVVAVGLLGFLLLRKKR